MPSSNQTPPIRGFQFDASSVGNVKNSVNLFRGDVNLTQALFTMPGRTQDQTLDVNISLLYQSNVFTQAGTWNRDAPTGVAGMGWSMPVTSIELDQSAGDSPTARSYSYVVNGSPSTLVREPETPFVFSVSSSEAGAFEKGQTIPEGLLSAFGEHGLAVSASAVMETNEIMNGCWLVSDSDARQSFLLRPSDAGWDVHDGGESYQLQSYKFWKILYYPEWERWSVTDEAGTVSSFGGLVQGATDLVAGSDGNSIEWAVGWSGATQERKPVLWTGSSAATTGQMQYARAWNLATTTNLWGDCVRYAYNEQWQPSNGIRPVVEQQVGTGGLPYTKACYLTSVTDVFGRKAIFSYADKLWLSGETSPREYADPHKSTPDNLPNGFQDQYETQYLQSIDVQGTEGEALFSVELEYCPRPGATADGVDVSSVANVATNVTGSLEGDTYKRFLTAIHFSEATGGTKPSIKFDYYLQPETDSSGATISSPGALSSMTSPQGSVSQWEYTKMALEICDRSLEVDRPSEFSSDSTPRVWFGPNYAVTAWYDRDSCRLALQVYSWYGRWIPWTPEAGVMTIEGGLDVNNMVVSTSEGCFAVGYHETDQFNLLLYAADPSRPGWWLEAQVNDASSGQELSQPLTYSTSNATVDLQAGDLFLLISSMDTESSTYMYDRLTWRWTTRTWTLEHFDNLSTYSFLTCQADSYLLLDSDGNAKLHRLGANLRWNDTLSPCQIEDFSVSKISSVALASGGSFAVVSQLWNNSGYNGYTVYILQWDAMGSFQPVVNFGCKDPINSTPTPWQPTVVSNTLIACAGNVFRFDGQTWRANSNLVLNTAPATGSQQVFAYGPDYAVQVYKASDGTVNWVKVLGYDADTDGAGWNDSEPQSPASPPKFPKPTSHANLANFPSPGSDDFVAIGQYLYFRGTSTDWGTFVEDSSTLPTDLKALVATAIGNSPDAPSGSHTWLLDSQSAINQGPQFLAYSVYDGGAQTSQLSAAILLRNGQALAQSTLMDDQRLITKAESDAVYPGTSPSGPDTFVTYPSSAAGFSEAGSFTLHRYAGNSVDGSIVHYAVTKFSATDGFGGKNSSIISPDPSQATCDSTGQVVKYYETTVYPGADTIAPPPYGSMVVNYLNGLSIMTGQNYYDMLDGLMNSVTMRDSTGAILSSTNFAWQVYVQRAPDPSDPSQAPVALAGGFVCRTGITRVKDSVTTNVALTYVDTDGGFTQPWSAQRVKVQSTIVGSGGTPETTVSTTSYACQYDENFRAQNILNTKAQSGKSWTPAGGDQVPMNASATTWASWPCARGSGVMVPAMEASFSWTGGASTNFPYSSYTPGDNPDGWQLARRVPASGRTALGLTTEGVDACGIVSSVLYGGVQSLPVAQITNASLLNRAWAFLGCEPYENESPWSSSGTNVVTGDAYTGTQSLQLPMGSAQIAATVNAPAGETYVLGYALKTPRGYQKTAGAGWSIAVSTTGASITRQSVEFEDTAGVWVFRTVSIPVPAGTDSSSITATAVNTVGQPVLLDALFIGPLTSSLTARTFNPQSGQATSSMNAGGRRSITVLNRSGKPFAQLDTLGHVQQLSQAFLSRQGNANDAFDETCPNANLALQPAGGGVMDTFNHGAEWQTRWEASALSSNWHQTSNVLAHTAQANDTLTWKGWKHETPQSAALFFEAHATNGLSGPLTIEFGSGYSLGWDPSTGKWNLTNAGAAVQTALAAPPQVAETWLLIFGKGTLSFFAGGQLIFSTPWSDGVPETIAIATGPSAIEFRNLAMLALPRLSVTFADAAGRSRQSQQLSDGDAIIRQTIYDPLGRTVALTKAAPASFGADADLPLLTYHPHFADEQSFLASMATTWELDGDVSDYYAGQRENGILRSNDENYAYSGSRYEDSARRRRLESGQPGQYFAINNTEDASQRHTTQYVYGSNEGGESVPAGSYFVKTTISPLKSQTTHVVNAVKRKIEVSTADSGGTQTSLSRLNYLWKSGSLGAGSQQSLQLPNSIISGPQSGENDFVTVTQQNAIGQLVGTEEPNCGPSANIYDPAGRIRFQLPPLDPGESYFLYCKYDALGRLIEQGSVPGAWNVSTLIPQAANPAWPDETVTHTVARTCSYDGDGSKPAQIGQMLQVVTNTSAPSSLIPGTSDCQSTESYTYDLRGRKIAVTLAFSLEGLTGGTVRYGYNNLSQITRVEYPEGSPLEKVFYRYDDLGRVSCIGTSPTSHSDIASYSYNAEGNTEIATINEGAVQMAYQYNSPGWLLSQAATPRNAQSPCWSLQFAYYPDATVQQGTESRDFDATPASTVRDYAYDSQRRLLSATVQGGEPGSDAITSYDANGNIWAATADGTPADFTCVSGSDRLSSVQLGNNSPVTPSYDAAGHLTGLADLSAVYDPCIALPTGFTVAGTSNSSVQLGYGAQGKRTCKLVTGGTSLTQSYLFGVGNRPLAICANGSWKVFVYGPTGIAAIVSDQRYFPIQDPQQTVRAVLDSSNNLAAAYSYRAFGAPLAATGPNSDLTPFRFMGQEWDAETQLYNFGARTYNPALCRFHEPDPGGQFASPYVFVGNDPITMVDTDGQSSHWAQLTGGIIMGAVAVGGVALSLFTGGASDAVAAGVDGAMAAAEAGEDALELAQAGIDATELAADTSDAADAAEATDTMPTSEKSPQSDEISSGASAGEDAPPESGSSSSPANQSRAPGDDQFTPQRPQQQPGQRGRFKFGTHRARTIAAHGQFVNTGAEFQDYFRLPEEITELHFFTQHGEALDNELGRAIDRRAFDLGNATQVFVQDGGLPPRVPNYHVYPIEDAMVDSSHGAPVRVQGQTTLSNVLRDMADQGYSGHVYVAICRNVLGGA